MVETALASALEELERVKKMEEEQKALLRKLMEKMEAMEKRFTEHKPAPVQPLNTAPLVAAIVKGITRLQQTIEAQPKTVTKEYRVLLFPEYGAQEYYRIVFGRVIFWMVIVLAATYLFVLGKQAIEKWSVINKEQIELNNNNNAWQQPYKTAEKKSKRK